MSQGYIPSVVIDRGTKLIGRGIAIGPIMHNIDIIIDIFIIVYNFCFVFIIVFVFTMILLLIVYNTTLYKKCCTCLNQNSISTDKIQETIFVKKYYKLNSLKMFYRYLKYKKRNDYRYET